MQLHIGDNRSIPFERMLFVLNARGMTDVTRAYVERAKKARRLRKCRGAPKSYVVVNERGREVIYESLLASATLKKRMTEEMQRKFLFEEAVFTVTEA